MNHAVLAVGYHVDMSNPNNSYIKIKNSWGSNWGESGYFRVNFKNDLSNPYDGTCNILKSD